jgi:hypothetical protein
MWTLVVERSVQHRFDGVTNYSLVTTMQSVTIQKNLKILAPQKGGAVAFGFLGLYA